MKVKNNILETKEGVSMYRGKRRNNEEYKKVKKKQYIYMHTYIYKSIVHNCF